MKLSVQGRSAYYAARLAECALAQGTFALAHNLLISTRELSELAPDSVAAAVGVANHSEYVECASQVGPRPSIEEDLALARSVGVNATPTFVINGTKLGSTPDSAALVRRIKDIMGMK
jgi:protein-disulfide isomerase